MVLVKCGLCQTTIHGKPRKVGNGKFLEEVTRYVKSGELIMEVTSGSSICNKCRLKVSKELLVNLIL